MLNELTISVLPLFPYRVFKRRVPFINRRQFFWFVIREAKKNKSNLNGSAIKRGGIIKELAI